MTKKEFLNGAKIDKIIESSQSLFHNPSLSKTIIQLKKHTSEC